MEITLSALAFGTVFVLGGLRFTFQHMRLDGTCVVLTVAGLRYLFPPEILVTVLNPADLDEV